MNRKQIRIITIALFILTLCICAASGASAEYGTPDGNWSYAIVDGHANIGYCGTSSVVSIPMYISKDGTRYPVYRVNLQRSVAMEEINTDEIPITSITFQVDENGCTPVREIKASGSRPVNITHLEVPMGVTTLLSFQRLPYLKTVTLAESVTTLNNLCFYECSALESINLSNVINLGTNTFTGTALREAVLRDGITEIPYALFRNCSQLTNVTIPDSVTSIGYMVFNGCSSLPAIDIPMNVTSIGEYAFEDCSSLEELILPDGITRLEAGLLHNCASLQNLHLPDNLQHISPLVFDGCSSLEELFLPASLSSLYNSNPPPALRKLVLADGIGLTEIPWGKMDELEELTAPVTVISRAGSEWKPFPKLKKATISRVEILKNCHETLEELTLLDPSRTNISLQDHIALRKLVLPEGLEKLPRNAFKGCIAMEEANLPSTLQEIGTYAFSGCPIRQITIPSGVSCIDYVFEYNTALPYVSIPNSVQSMEGAFRGCTALAIVDMPWEETSVTALKYAFQDCASLQSVWLSPYITNLYYAFSGCTSLNEVLLSEDGPAFSNTQHAFENCASLSGIWVPEGKFAQLDTCIFAGSGLVDIEIPEGVAVISTNAFQGCPYLQQVSLPQSLNVLGDLAFADCPMLGSLDVPDRTSVSYTAFENDWIYLTVTQGSDAWVVAVDSAEDGVHARFRDQMEVAEGTYVTLWSDDSSHMTLYAPQVVPDGNYYYFYVLESADGSWTDHRDGQNMLSADFEGLDLDNSVYTGYVWIGYDGSSIDQANRCIRMDYNGVYGGSILWEPDINTAVNAAGEIRFISGLAFANYLPQNLTAIESEAFDGTALDRRFIVCWPGVESIGSRAFAGSGIQAIYLPESVRSVGAGAFDGCDVTVYCVAGSWAESWANSRGLPCHAMEKDE